MNAGVAPVTTATHGGRVNAVRAVFLFVFFVSGFAALVYQIIWQRLLTLFGGSDVVSVTIIVSAFMAGLGFGNLAGGHLADRIAARWRLFAFAGCELAVALFAVGSVTIYYDLLYTRLGSWAVSRPLMGTIVFLVTLWPTFFMGMSLPLAAKALTDDAQQPARWIPLLYGWNTIGAACGSFFAVTVLFRMVSFSGALRVGAALSFSCSLVAAVAAPFLIRRLSLTAIADPVADERAIDVSPSGTGFSIGGWIGLYALSGFIALSLEILWFRVLGIVLKSNSFTFGHLLGVYLGGVGLGALLANMPLVRRWRPVPAFFLLQGIIPLYAAFALTIFLGMVGQTSVGGPLWEYMAGSEPLALNDIPANISAFLAAYLAVPLWLIGPPTLMMGLTFGLLQRAVQTDLRVLGRRLGWLQTANIAGSMCGALGTGLVLLRWLGSVGTLRLLVAAGAGFLFLYARSSSNRHGLRAAIAVLVVVATVVAIPAPAKLWARLHGSTTTAAVVFAEDGTGVSVLKRFTDGGRTTTVYANGLGQSVLPYGNVHTELAALSLMVHPHPVSIAVIGLGSGDTLFSSGGRPETRAIDSIEIVAAEHATLQALGELDAYRGLHMLLQDPRVRYSFTDGRAYLRATDRRYDLIEADALRPRSAYSGNLYSAEYFQLLSDRLQPGGIAVSWLPTDRVRDTMIRVFPHVRVFGGIGFGSRSPIAVDPAVVRQRLQHPFTQRYYAAAGIPIERLLAPYLSNPSTAYGPEFDRSRLVDINSDLFAKDEFALPRAE